MKGFYMKDGSGLTVANYFTPSNMTEILAASYKEPYFRVFYNSIPTLGLDGTVKNIGNIKKSKGKIVVKSGTIEKVKTFAGYFKAKNGEMMCFSLMANQFESSESAMSRDLAKLFDMMIEL